MMRRWASIVCLALLAGARAGQGQPLAPPQVAVSPSRFEVELDGPVTTHALKLINMGKNDITARVRLADWVLDEDNRVVEVTPGEASLMRWMVINPLSFTVPGGETQTVRFSIRPRTAPAEGEHRAMIYLEELPRREPGKAVTVVFNIGVAVYAYAGKITRSGSLHGVRVESRGGEPTGLLDVESSGNAHVRLDGRYTVWRADALPAADPAARLADAEQELPTGAAAAGSLPVTPVLPGTRRTLALPFGRGLEPGRYVLVVGGTLGENRFDGESAFTVEPPPTPTPTPAETPTPGPASPTAAVPGT
jgi:P pilus assembly chaperone PapD